MSELKEKSVFLIAGVIIGALIIGGLLYLGKWIMDDRSNLVRVTTLATYAEVQGTLCKQSDFQLACGNETIGFVSVVPMCNSTYFELKCGENTYQYFRADMVQELVNNAKVGGSSAR